jgi:hypothetical protein
MRRGGRDWMKNQTLNMAAFFDYKIDIYHIFPKAWCLKNGIDQVRRESIVNKTALSSQTNQRIGGASPAAYLSLIEKSAGLSSDELDGILRSHAIEPELLRSVDFDAFFAARVDALLELVETAMGKRSVRKAETLGEQADSPDSFELEPDDLDEDIEIEEPSVVVN